MLIRLDRYGLTYCRQLGAAGAAIVALGGLIAGALPTRDPLDFVPGLGDMRKVPEPAVMLVYVGLTLLLVAWWQVGGLIRRPGGPSRRELAVTLGWWMGPLMLAVPLFSRDVYSYLAQGAMTANGIDAYSLGPSALGGPLAADVPEIWLDTPAPYGPVFLGLASAGMTVTGDDTVLGIMFMRAMAVAGVLMLLWAVPRLAQAYGVDPSSAIWLGVLNPLVLLHLGADAHNDALMLGLMAVGLVLTVEGHQVLGTVAVTLATLVKAPVGLALAFMIPMWAAQMTGRGRWARAGLRIGLIAGVTLVMTTYLAGTGYGWIAALDTPTLAHTWTSITTDIGFFTGQLTDWLGVATVDQTTAVWRFIGLGAAGVVCLRLWQRSAQIGPVVGLGIGLGAIVMLGPVVHPWYLLWATVPLAAAATAERTRRIVAVGSATLTLLVMPGGVQPNLSTLSWAILGTGATLAVLVAATGLDRRYLRAPLGTGAPSGQPADQLVRV